MKFTPSAIPRINTDRLVLKLLEPHDAQLMTEFRIRNRDHLTQWEPLRAEPFYTEPFWQVQLRLAIREFRSGNSVCLSIMNNDESQVLGVCNYTNVIRGTFEACHLGYALSDEQQGKGIMYEALTASTEYIFSEFKLHRIMANYLPRNKRSGDLLKRLGFTVEGEAKKFLKINGVWEDHILTALVEPAAR